jgi:hypothetical protein
MVAFAGFIRGFSNVTVTGFRARGYDPQGYDAPSGGQFAGGFKIRQKDMGSADEVIRRQECHRCFRPQMPGIKGTQTHAGAVFLPTGSARM